MRVTKWPDDLQSENFVVIRLFLFFINRYKAEKNPNVINLRKRTMPDIITPLYRVKIFGIALDMKSS